MLVIVLDVAASCSIAVAVTAQLTIPPIAFVMPLPYSGAMILLLILAKKARRQDILLAQ